MFPLPREGRLAAFLPAASGGDSSGDFHDIGAPLTEVCSDGIEIEVEAITGEDGQAARSAVKPEMVKLWLLAGAAMMLTSMKAVTIANACAHPRLAAARRGNAGAKRVGCNALLGGVVFSVYHAHQLARRDSAGSGINDKARLINKRFRNIRRCGR